MAVPIGGGSIHCDSALITPPSRSSSRASTNSNASGASLARRPRTRARARTLTGNRPDNIRTDLATTGCGTDAFISSASHQLSVDSSAGDGHAITPTQIDFNVSPPVRPPRSPQRSTSTAIPGMESVFLSGSLEVSQAQAPLVQTAPLNTTELRKVCNLGVEDMSTVAHGESCGAPPDRAIEDFSIPLADSSRPHARDSVLTQNSTTTSSSVFPPSTPTASSPQSPSSLISIMPLDAVAGTTNHSEFDGDDVSYRLQLLVKNNYFLPPAHQKPSPSDFAPSSLRARKQTPTFLDLFRIGKTRSKPPTPDSSTECLAPVLRTTSDSSTAAGHVQRSPLTPVRSVQSAPLPDPTARVVVVREKMADLASAARQAELDMKARRERGHGSRTGSRGSMRSLRNQLAMIDPTDAVDLPPPSAGYPFAVQTSALHGLTVKESVGAADLAEHLPPPDSPGTSTLDAEEIAWRKALLQEAVNLSLHTPTSSVSSSSKGSISKSTTMPATSSSSEGSKSPSTKRMLGQKIIQQMALEQIDLGPMEEANRDVSVMSKPASSSILTGRVGRGLSTHESQTIPPRRSAELPSRAESPSNIHPLAPPPRKASNPALHVSQNIMHSTSQSGESTNARRSTSFDAQNSNRVGMVMTPPPVPHMSVTLSQSFHSESGVSSVDSHRWVDSVATSSSCFSEAEADATQPRPSVALSVDHPSMSEYSQPSPKGSAFGDAYDNNYSHTRSSHERQSISRTSAASHQPRELTMSPPPRASSASMPTALTPPPRSSSLHYRVTEPAFSISPPPLPASDPGHDLRIINRPLSLGMDYPEPITPASIAERRTRLAPTLLQINVGEASASVHSAPSSPISFFDQIESNAVDEIDSSDDSDLEEGYQTASQEVPRLPSLDVRLPGPSNEPGCPRPAEAPDPKHPLMRLGNHSTPHVSRSGLGSPVGFHFNEPVTTAPPRRVLTRKKISKSDHGHGPISSATFKYMMQQLEPEAVRLSVSTENNVVALSHKQKNSEWTKLDGMLIQHMEREKDTLKRIATSTRTKI